MPTVGNSAVSGNAIAALVAAMLQARLPAGWTATIQAPPKAAPFDGVLRIRRDGSDGTVRLGARSRVEPKDVDYLAATLRPTPDEPVLIAAPYLSPRTQERLRSHGFAYADPTGNVRLEMTEPGLFIETAGARENPEPSPRDRKSLKGAKAGRIVRALCDFRPPVGLRELAKRAGVDPGYSSRVVDFLDREALVTRTPRGPITTVDWRALLKRWSQEYSPFRRQGATMYLSARGIPAVIERLTQLNVRYAVTASWAASEVAPVAPPRLLTLYVDRPRDVEQALDLRSAEAGANVALFTPFDEIVFERTSATKGVTIAAISQIAVDLMRSPGRGPNEAEALLQWMQENEDAWRT